MVEIGQKIYFSAPVDAELERGDWAALYVDAKTGEAIHIEPLADELKDEILTAAAESGELTLEGFDPAGLFRPEEGERGFLVQVETDAPALSVRVMIEMED